MKQCLQLSLTFNRLSLRKASNKYGVPKSSLNDHVTGKVPEGARWGKQPIFTAREETEMVQCAAERAKMGIDFIKPNFLRFAGAMAKSKGILLKQGKPSDMWWRRLKSRRTDFSLRTPEPTGTARHVAMSRERLQRYFEALGEIVLSQNFHDQPCKIWNMYETGMTLAHKPSKVLGKKRCMLNPFMAKRPLLGK